MNWSFGSFTFSQISLSCAAQHTASIEKGIGWALNRLSSLPRAWVFLFHPLHRMRTTHREGKKCANIEFCAVHSSPSCDNNSRLFYHTSRVLSHAASELRFSAIRVVVILGLTVEPAASLISLLKSTRIFHSCSIRKKTHRKLLSFKGSGRKSWEVSKEKKVNFYLLFADFSCESWGRRAWWGLSSAGTAWRSFSSLFVVFVIRSVLRKCS